jgi:hypothetical protein
MSDDTDITYQKYAEAVSERTDVERRISNLNLLTEDLKSIVKSGDKDGSYGLHFTDHALARIADRLEELAYESRAIYEDVVNPNNHDASLMLPTNLRVFIIGLLAKARIKKAFSCEDSKNNPGNKEYQYFIEIRDWSTESHKLMFTGVVERNAIKTGYFNWVPGGNRS